MSRHLESIKEREAAGEKRAFEISQRAFFIEQLSRGGDNDHALSVSCGDGIWDYLALGNHTGIRKITATDIVRCPVQEQDVAMLKSLGDWNFTQVKPDTALPFDEESFNVVYHQDVVEHTEMPYLFLREQHRVLKKGGRIVVGTPNLFRPMNVLKVLTGRLKFPHEMGFNEEIGAYTHVQEFHAAQLELLLKETGFTHIEIIPLFFGIQPLNIEFSRGPSSLFGQTLCQFLIGVGWKETKGDATNS